MEKQVCLYAFDSMNKVVNFKFLPEAQISVSNINRLANWMKVSSPERVSVYAIDNRCGLRAEYTESLKSNDFTKHIAFRDLVVRDGILVSA